MGRHGEEKPCVCLFASSGGWLTSSLITFFIKVYHLHVVILISIIIRIYVCCLSVVCCSFLHQCVPDQQAAKPLYAFVNLKD